MNAFTKTSIPALLAASLLIGCGGDDGGSNAKTPDETGGEVVTSDLARVTDPNVDANDVAAQVAGNNAFAVDLYKASVVGTDGMISSPYSASIALAMTYAGARGETATEMAQVLHYDLEQEKLHPVFNHLDLELESRGQGAQGQDDDQPFRLRIANAIWGQADFPFEQDYLDTLALNYGAGLRVLDFAADPDSSRETINLWVEDQTEEKIKDLLPDGSITPNTRLVLTNAIYFNAAWQTPFEEGATQSASFTTAAGQSVNVDQMNQLETHNYARIGTADVAELMYDGGEVSMVIIHPDDLAAFEQNELDGAFIDSLDTELAPSMVQLGLPKFQIETTLPLTQTLQDMGMILPFTDADFSGMSAGGGLVITDVIQKAFINLDESGTEAAAATAVVVGETSVPVADVEMNVDSPFIYLIRDVETGSIIFIGRVTDPS